MGTSHPEQHQNELPGRGTDTSKPGVPSDAPTPEQSRYRKMKCYYAVNGRLLGWLGTYNDNVDVVTNEKLAAEVAWSWYESDMYLRKTTSPNDRFLGLGWHGYACWSLAGGWNDAIIYNADHTISLKSDPSRKLSLCGNNWICWSEGESNQNILRFEF
jgi:hypothetical protein